MEPRIQGFRRTLNASTALPSQGRRRALVCTGFWVEGLEVEGLGSRVQGLGFKRALGRDVEEVGEIPPASVEPYRAVKASALETPKPNLLGSGLFPCFRASEQSPLIDADPVVGKSV